MNTFFFSVPQPKGTDPWYKKNDQLVQAAIARVSNNNRNANQKGVKS